MLDDIEAVTLDAAGTLVEPWPSVGDVYARVAEECGIGPVSAGELNRRFGKAWKTKQGFDYSRIAWRKMVEQTFAGLAPLKPAFFDHLYEEFAQPRCWRVYEDVAPGPGKLSRQGVEAGSDFKLGRTPAAAADTNGSCALLRSHRDFR
jgi:putative hydrolase of the HAD superfamily